MKFILPFLIISILACTDNAFLLAPSSEGFNYTPLFNSKVDILMVVDNSGSMDKHQEYLASSSYDFVKRLKDLEFDFQIGVTSTDLSANGHRGKLIGSPTFLNPKSANIGNSLRERILIGVGGSSMEEGLGGARMALSEPNLSESNSGFLRPDAFLLLVILSNENDSGSEPLQNYIEFFEALKPPTDVREKGWMLNFIGVTGLPGEDCKTFGDYRGIGTRYMDIAQFSHGHVSTICTANLSYAVKGVEKSLLTLLTEIVLSRSPKIETLRVFFNGVETPNNDQNGWSYNKDRNSVLFHGNYIPKVKTKIDILFDPVGTK